jgi:hypothetical protein
VGSDEVFWIYVHVSGKDAFPKTRSFKEHKFYDLVVMRVLYRLKLCNKFVGI